MLKNITLSANDNLIRKARERATTENTTLNAEFRLWLEKYVDRPHASEDYSYLMAGLRYVVPGKNFTRDELNER